MEKESGDGGGGRGRGRGGSGERERDPVVAPVSSLRPRPSIGSARASTEGRRGECVRRWPWEEGARKGGRAPMQFVGGGVQFSTVTISQIVDSL